MERGQPRTLTRFKYFHVLCQLSVREGWRHQVGRIFGKFQKGGGGIFNPKIYAADFGDFKPGFLSMKLIQKSKFRVQGKFLDALASLKTMLDIH